MVDDQSLNELSKKLEGQEYNLENIINSSELMIKSLDYNDRDKEMFKLIDALGIKKNKYIISSYGRVFYTDVYGFSHSGEKFLKEVMRVSRDSYISVRLKQENGDKCDYYVHDLVALSFIKNWDYYIKLDGACISHKNGLRTCNYYKNLKFDLRKRAHTHKGVYGVSE